MKAKLIAALLMGAVIGSGTLAFAESSGDGVINPRRSIGAGLQELAGRLNARDRALQRRQASIADREADLREAEQRLEVRLVEMEALRSEIDAKLAALDEIEERRRQAVTEMAEKMRSKQSGPFIAAMDDTLAVDLLDRMQPAKAAKILAAMPPAKAARLAEQLTAPIPLDTNP
ncbi:MAG: hypothetical protein AAGA48_06410 [Myxococcota bacterium]